MGESIYKSLPKLAIVLIIFTGVFGLGIGDSDGQTIVAMEVNMPFQLKCNVSTIPENASAVVAWFKEDEPINTSSTHITIKNDVLQIKKPTDNDWGYYTCQPNISNPTLNYTYAVYTKPRIDPPFQKSVSHIQGETLTLSCTVFGKPDPDIVWKKGDEIINPSNESRITIEKTEKGSDLKIATLEEDDRAEYTCSINNTVGSDNSTILVRVKDKLAALWPFLGIVAEVGVLCTIIFIYEKRRAKQEFEESDTDQSPDTKNVADNKEKDVRQRK
uniref:Neuroplastin n=1 Tax=Hemiscolopendra marginata TaxID=943146 RepID=A0A646QI82_9MYRI